MKTWHVTCISHYSSHSRIHSDPDYLSSVQKKKVRRGFRLRNTQIKRKTALANPSHLLKTNVARDQELSRVSLIYP